MLRQVAFMLAAIHRLASIVARQYIAFYTSLPVAPTCFKSLAEIHDFEDAAFKKTLVWFFYS